MSSKIKCRLGAELMGSPRVEREALDADLATLSLASNTYNAAAFIAALRKLADEYESESLLLGNDSDGARQGAEGQRELQQHPLAAGRISSGPIDEHVGGILRPVERFCSEVLRSSRGGHEGTPLRVGPELVSPDVPTTTIGAAPDIRSFVDGRESARAGQLDADGPGLYCPNPDHDGAQVPAVRHLDAERDAVKGVPFWIATTRCEYCAEGLIARLVREGWRVTTWAASDTTSSTSAASSSEAVAS